MIPILSRWINYKDAIKSATAMRYGIDNTPGPDALVSMKVICMAIYDPLCDYFNRPIPVTSFYRCPTLNAKIGGSATSQHTLGEAMDLDVDGVGDRRINNCIIFNHIRKRLNFDQLIWEYGDDDGPDWVHVSYKAGHNRGQILRAIKNEKNKTEYIPL